MSEPIAPFQTDDVLSSVRRLVSQDQRAAAGAEPFVLSDTWRVETEDFATDPQEPVGKAAVLSLEPYRKSLPQDMGARTVLTSSPKDDVLIPDMEKVADRVAMLMDDLFGADKSRKTRTPAPLVLDESYAIAPQPAEQGDPVAIDQKTVDHELALQVMHRLSDGKTETGDASLQPYGDPAISLAPDDALRATIRDIVREEVAALVQRELGDILQHMKRDDAGRSPSGGNGL